MTEWQKIETAPKDGTNVLLVNVDGVWTVTSIYIGWWHEKEQKWVNAYTGQADFQPSHWMPLPERPNVR